MTFVRLHSIAAPLAACVLACAGIASAAAQTANRVPGESLDSGLGSLQPYSQWQDRTGKTVVSGNVAGQKLDSGLGELPPYSEWSDRSGKFPVKLDTGSRTLASGR